MNPSLKIASLMMAAVLFWSTTSLACGVPKGTHGPPEGQTETSSE